ncbi:MAG: c-type cytochrome [Planctomycetaceae bacterium]|nr:c-type cytochrome [Planctomycetaceae bacterium]
MVRSAWRLLGGTLAILLTLVTPVAAAPAGSAGAVMNLLRSGKVPPERLGPVLEIVCTRGNAQELAYVYEQVLQPDAFPEQVRVDVLQKLADAALTRKVIPDGDLGGIAGLLTAEASKLRTAAIPLCGLWGVRAAIAPLSQVATDVMSSDADRTASLNALLRIDPIAAATVIETLTGDSQPFVLRAEGIAALTRIDLAKAAALSAGALAEGTAGDDPSRIVDAFLERQGGSDALASALGNTPPPEDVAKLALRRMYAVGRSDAALSSVLEQAAKVAGKVTTPTGADLAALIAEVGTHGDPARGEAVFRRSDLSCLKCHAVSQAGGQIGPDLSAVGSNSPVDYLVTAVYDPDAQIKEAYVSKTVLTVDGLTLQGIVVDRTDQRLVLKDADGRRHEIPLADIDDEIEGKSLMPKGLVKFMTQQEIVDVLAFLSQLGRPGPYAVRATPRMQRWRALKDVPLELQTDIPNDELFEDRILKSAAWSPIYARVDGALPLDEAVEQSASGSVIYLQGEFDVQTAGPIGIRAISKAPLSVWVDSEAFSTGGDVIVPATAGRHSVTLRVDSTGHDGADVRLELFRPADSPAVFAVVDGQ